MLHRRPRSEPAFLRAGPLRVSGRDGVSREQHVGLLGRDAPRRDIRKPLPHALDERFDEAGVVEELANLVDLNDVAEPGLFEGDRVVLAVLAAARV